VPVIGFDVELPVPGKEDLAPSPARRTLHRDKKYKTDIVRAETANTTSGKECDTGILCL